MSTALSRDPSIAPAIRRLLKETPAEAGVCAIRSQVVLLLATELFDSSEDRSLVSQYIDLAEQSDGKPDEPFANRFGNAAGNTAGSSFEPS